MTTRPPNTSDASPEHVLCRLAPVLRRLNTNGSGKPSNKCHRTMCTCEDANSGYLAGSRPAAWSRGPTRDMNVDAENITGATALYEQVGMRVINRWDVRERALGNSRGS